MQLTDIKPGAALLWRHTRFGFEYCQAVHVVRKTPTRVIALVMTSRGTARRVLKPEKLFRKGHRPS